VDPSAVIRPEYVAFQVATKDGRSLTGLVVESTPSAVTLVNEKNERTVLARTQIELMEASPVSLMPEKILDPLTDQEICDLFAYLQADGPPKEAKAEAELRLNLRTQSLKQDREGRNFWQPATTPAGWKPSETAIIVCDMWDKHWSKGATDRCGA